MAKSLGTAGSVIGVLGVLICLVAGFARLFGSYHVAGYEAMTLFNVGVGVMVLACLIKLHQLSLR